MKSYPEDTFKVNIKGQKQSKVLSYRRLENLGCPLKVL